MDQLIQIFIMKHKASGTELEDLLIRGKHSGWKRCRCPKCSTQRTNRQERCLAVRHKEGDIYVICHHCGWRSGVTTTRRRSGKLPTGSWNRFGNSNKNGSSERKFVWL